MCGEGGGSGSSPFTDEQREAQRAGPLAQGRRPEEWGLGRTAPPGPVLHQLRWLGARSVMKLWLLLTEMKTFGYRWYPLPRSNVFFFFSFLGFIIAEIIRILESALFHSTVALGRKQGKVGFSSGFTDSQMLFFFFFFPNRFLLPPDLS